MMTPSRTGAKIVAATLAAGLALEAAAAAAQPPPPNYYPPPPSNSPSDYPPQNYQRPDYQRPDYPPPDYQRRDERYEAQRDGPQIAPPPGEYAPPPPGYERSGSVYDDRAQRADRDYAERYSRWAAQYCMDKRANNTAAGAIIGGILGAVVGSNVAGHGSKTGGSIIGGALGATAGAAIGRSTAENGGCPPGYYVRSGAPAFYYPGPTVYAGPAWYNPWFFEGGTWIYRPYRYWYWTHNTYWRPGWRPGPWDYHYRHY